MQSRIINMVCMRVDSTLLLLGHMPEPLLLLVTKSLEDNEVEKKSHDNLKAPQEPNILLQKPINLLLVNLRFKISLSSISAANSHHRKLLQLKKTADCMFKTNPFKERKLNFALKDNLRINQCPSREYVLIAMSKPIPIKERGDLRL